MGCKIPLTTPIVTHPMLELVTVVSVVEVVAATETESKVEHDAIFRSFAPPTPHCLYHLVRHHRPSAVYTRPASLRGAKDSSIGLAPLPTDVLQLMVKAHNTMNALVVRTLLTYNVAIDHGNSPF